MDKKDLLTMLFFLLLVCLFPYLLHSQSVTDELTEQILRLQLLEMTYQKQKQNSLDQEKQLKQSELLIQNLEQSNLKSQQDLQKVTKDSEELSRAYKALETRYKGLKVSLTIMIPATVVMTSVVTVMIVKNLEVLK